MHSYRLFLVLAAVAMFTGACALAATPSQRAASRPASTQPAPSAVAAVWFEMGYPPPGEREPRRLIVGVWSDGTVIWSKNNRTGGKPYFNNRINAARVEKLAHDLNAAGFFSLTQAIFFGPDASYTVIAAKDGERLQWVGSWHEPTGDNPNTVITEKGMIHVEPGDPRPEPSKEYQSFLKVWADSRKLIEAVVPANGQPAELANEEVFRLGRER